MDPLRVAEGLGAHGCGDLASRFILRDVAGRRDILEFVVEGAIFLKKGLRFTEKGSAHKGTQF
jgi:hypothetical protein